MVTKTRPTGLARYFPIRRGKRTRRRELPLSKPIPPGTTIPLRVSVRSSLTALETTTQPLAPMRWEAIRMVGVVLLGALTRLDPIPAARKTRQAVFRLFFPIRMVRIIRPMAPTRSGLTLVVATTRPAAWLLWLAILTAIAIQPLALKPWSRTLAAVITPPTELPHSRLIVPVATTPRWAS